MVDHTRGDCQDVAYEFRLLPDLEVVYLVLVKNTFLHVEDPKPTGRGRWRNKSAPPRLTSGLQKPKGPSFDRLGMQKIQTARKSSEVELLSKSSDEVAGGSSTLARRWSDDSVDVESLLFVARSSTTTTVQDVMARSSDVPGVSPTFARRWSDDSVDDVESLPFVTKSSSTGMVEDLMARHGKFEAPTLVTRSSTSDRAREEEQPQMATRHAAGTCLPCIFNMKVPPSCKFGDGCTHCHLCTVDEAKKRRNRISYEKRKINRKPAQNVVLQ